jgi:L-fuculose-phosphate aldolase
VPRSIEKLITLYNAVLLANHGALAVGANLDEAMQRMERVEHLAKITLVSALLGGAKTLSEGEITKIMAAG